jgi:hypothetical protein
MTLEISETPTKHAPDFIDAICELEAAVLDVHDSLTMGLIAPVYISNP